MEKRGLLNLKTTPDAMPSLLLKKNMDMLIGQGVFSKAELVSRYEIMLENYCKTVIIEANTMVDMARKEILPAVETYIADLAGTACEKDACGIKPVFEKKLLKQLSEYTEEIDSGTDALEKLVGKIHAVSDVTKCAQKIRDELIPAMDVLRKAADGAEQITAAKYWPFPTYGDLLFGVK